MSKSLHGISAGNTQQYVTNKTRIVAFGCSFTQGVGLDHRTTHMTHYGAYSLKAWPNLTARLLSDDQYAVPCVNHGDGGASSCNVLDHILEEEILPDDIVVMRHGTLAVSLTTSTSRGIGLCTGLNLDQIKRLKEICTQQILI